MRITVHSSSGPISLDRLTDEQRHLLSGGIRAAWTQVCEALSAASQTNGWEFEPLAPIDARRRSREGVTDPAR